MVSFFAHITIELYTTKIYKHNKRSPRVQCPSPSQAILTSEDFSAHRSRKGNGLGMLPTMGCNASYSISRLLHSLIYVLEGCGTKSGREKG